MNILESHFTSDIVQHYSILAFRINFRGGIHELESVMGSSRSVGDIFNEGEEVTENQMRKACRDANILEFVESLPQGFNTEVGGRGGQLSGGQKREFKNVERSFESQECFIFALHSHLDRTYRYRKSSHKRPLNSLIGRSNQVSFQVEFHNYERGEDADALHFPYLSIHHSALDSESEKVVQAAIDKAAKGRTVISIAHRLSTIQKSDKIFCLQDGKVAEEGDHRTLVNLKGIYAELVRLQSLQT